MKTIALYNNEQVVPEEASLFRVRKAVRAIVVDDQGKVAIIHARKKHFYELPGGGVDDGESIADTAIRECKEEIGCDIAIGGDVGLIVEYRKKELLVKESYCYYGAVVGEKGTLSLVDDELDLDMVVIWASPEEAIAHIESSDTPTSYIAEFSIQRDVAFLCAHFQHTVISDGR